MGLKNNSRLQEGNLSSRVFLIPWGSAKTVNTPNQCSCSRPRVQTLQGRSMSGVRGALDSDLTGSNKDAEWFV